MLRRAARSKRKGNRVSQRIAVVGSGIAGLSAAWLLSRHRHAVTLFEAEGWLGGHTHTVEVELDGKRAPVDTGFLVFNDRTYPELIALFDQLGVDSAASDMSFSVRLPHLGIEWAGSNLTTLFAQKSNLLRPRFWSMVRDILRFNREAVRLLRAGLPEGLSLGAFLEERRYGHPFRDWYLLPMAAAIWSCPTREMTQYPCATFLRFCHNHGLLQISDRPRWRTVRGGGREYVRRMAADITEVRLNTPVERITRLDHAVQVRSRDGVQLFDQVVLACHSDQALALLGDADAAERRLLESIRYQDNDIVLHTDASFMPRARAAWSSWNYVSEAPADDGRPVSLSYWLNRLQPLPFTTAVIETLNPQRPPREPSVLGRFRYSHPVFDAAAVRAQAQLPSIQGRRRTWFCGAWCGYGFHEDGLKAGLGVARQLGAHAPWHAPVPAVAVREAIAA
jgi:predicted NAD/FAD-binding protein